MFEVIVSRSAFEEVTGRKAAEGIKWQRGMMKSSKAS